MEKYSSSLIKIYHQIKNTVKLNSSIKLVNIQKFINVLQLQGYWETAAIRNSGLESTRIENI